MSEPAADRLVIRIKLAPREPSPPPPAPAPRLSRGAVAAIVGAVLIVMGWFSIGSLRSDPPPPPAVAAKAPVAAVEPAPKPVEPTVQHQPDAAPSVLKEVIPDVPQSALDTIRGTIRVAVRVSIDKQGVVVAAAADDPGPSRYFKRLSIEAAKKWTFTPASSEEQRTMLVRFNFTRNGTTAHSGPPA